MSFTVLGPVGALTQRAVLQIAAPTQQALLAQLLLHANRTLSASALIDGIYGDAPPRHPEAALQIIVSRLRRALGNASDRIVYDGYGYRIDVAADELDLTRAQSHFSRGADAMRHSESAAAADAFNAALDCWTGEPLAGLTRFSFQHAHVRCLREFQFEILERRNDAYLECGQPTDVLRDIESWIAMEPWREGLRGQQMMALYRTGRQVDALATYDDTRELLLNGFGVDPSRELQQLYGNILRQELHSQDPRSFHNCENDVFIVEGGRNATWLVRRLTAGESDADFYCHHTNGGLRRVALADFVADGGELFVRCAAHGAPRVRLPGPVL
jgi:DNA-binding SARP family transcriptional activator